MEDGCFLECKNFILRNINDRQLSVEKKLQILPIVSEKLTNVGNLLQEKNANFVNFLMEKTASFATLNKKYREIRQ